MVGVLQLLDRTGVAAELKVELADGADVLLRAAGRLHLALAAQGEGDLYCCDTQRDHDQCDGDDRAEQEVTLFAAVARWLFPESHS